ncbi:MAG: branched-chain amino acid transport system II carrier protein [Enterobacteriaceae bacterium]
MTQRLSIADTIGLGFMTFAFFLGAGNIIFPPLEGQLAGTQVLASMAGFLLTAVGLPLAAIIAVARAGGGLPAMSRDLPKGTGVFAAVLLFIIIGPAFATPRTGLVAYEMAIRPLFPMVDAWSEAEIYLPSLDLHLDFSQMLATSLFFLVTLFFSWSRGKLIGYIGKVLTPALFLLLICLAVGVLLKPQGELMAPVGEYNHLAFSKGFLGGYNTMDTFAALMFGILLVDILRGKGVTELKSCARYLTLAGIIAAAGLAFVYISLFWLGATSGVIAPGASNGGEILAAYVQALFGEAGQWILSGVVLLACLTTSVGLISACADYFSSLTAIRYRPWVVILSVICSVVANVGLSRLISLSIPALLTLYPLAIVLVVLTFIRPWLKHPALVYRVVMLVTLLCSLIDALRSIGVQSKGIGSVVAWYSEHIPFVEQGMAWTLPALATLVVLYFLPARITGRVVPNVASS